ncbi:hypothetical protein [Methylomonas sp. UP202]|uniref:hypothetical protein n=1 Tax=Methylomonas sp. UP202 TaxID=3040943 RepID=UPI002479598C|nr:hypothetical protein [Methylomonas sp. UP202]WGS87525.1 hypothetical protein QC632_07140 [Methylomonas sp. UP202]
MSSIILDALEFANKFKADGFTEHQAEPIRAVVGVGLLQTALVAGLLLKLAARV